jgi:uncharacterized protein YbbC (DUF1343 family)
MLEQRLAAAVGEAAGKQMHRETVKLGIDTLEAYDFRPLLGRRVGLLSHSAGRDAAGHRTADILAHAKGVILAALFSPEHGFASASEQKVATQLDAETGLPVYSLYGDSLRPTDAMLQKLDAVVIDLQDVGARYYTYATTMAYMMEDAAQHGLEVYVLDRPNPIGNAVQGPMLDADQRSFTGYWPMPVRHGMTLGELAQMFNEMAGINVKLHVVSMRSYRRNMMFAGTGLNWIPPSPNLPSASAALLYAGVGLVEGANISVGRGTPTPFELVGAPWIDGDRLTSTLAARNLPGIRLQSANFIPDKDIYANQPCHGSRIQVTDPMVADLPRLGIEIIAALYRLYPRRFDVAATAKIIGSAMTFREIENGTPPDEIAADWRSNLSAFAAEREKFLIYPKGE